ncbi:MAG: hypothetical protein V5A68_05490 [Candidatus Thermoplasmatota archaeon]
MKLRYFSVAFSITGIACLYAITLISQPLPIDIGKIPEYEGKTVSIKGRIEQIISTEQESQILTLKNGENKTTVFLEGVTQVECGDKIKAKGTVQKYNDKWEIVVNNKKNIQIIKKWNKTTISLKKLSQKTEKYIDTRVKTKGYIESKFDKYIFITDKEKKYFLPVQIHKYQNNFQTGSKVSIEGKFIFEKEKYRYIIDCTEENSRIKKII